MGFLGLCKGDEMVDLLHDYFNANVLRIPEERVQPLTVVARRDGKQTFRGSLEPLLAEGPLAAIEPAPSHMAELSGKRTRSVDLGLGLEVLGGFLSGFGVPSAGVGTHLGSARELSFRFGDVVRLWIDPNLLGKRLDGHRIDPEGASARMYFGADAWQLLVVDSIITSNEFSISVADSGHKGASIDVPAIQAIVNQANAKVDVSSSSSTEVSFAGRQRLTFAFTLQRAYLDDSGRVSSLDPESTLLSEEAAARGEVIAPPRVQLSREPALLGWDDGPD